MVDISQTPISNTPNFMQNVAALSHIKKAHTEIHI